MIVCVCVCVRARLRTLHVAVFVWVHIIHLACERLLQSERSSAGGLDHIGFAYVCMYILQNVPRDHNREVSLVKTLRA